MTPFAAGIVLGYLLDPVVLKLQKLRAQPARRVAPHSRRFRPAVVLFFILVVPVLGGQFIAFAQHCRATWCGFRRSP